MMACAEKRGTEAGHGRHKRAGEVPCAECKAAVAAAARRRRAEWTPEQVERKRSADRAYRARNRTELNRKAREYSRQPEVRERVRKYAQRDYVKEKRREYNRRPEVRERKRKADHAYYAANADKFREYSERPDVRERRRLSKRDHYHNRGGREWAKEYRSRPDVVARTQSPEFKQRVKELNKERMKNPAKRERRREVLRAYYDRNRVEILAKANDPDVREKSKQKARLRYHQNRDLILSLNKTPEAREAARLRMREYTKYYRPPMPANMPNRGTRWSEGDVAFAVEKRAAGLSSLQIAVLMGRSPGAVAQKIRKASRD